MTEQEIIKKAYDAFNKRDIDIVIGLMQPDVNWPNGWEGGYVKSHEAVRDYWTRQWKEINPHVTPIAFNKLADERLVVDVQQTVKDMEGKLLFDGVVKHVYRFENNLIQGMAIE